MCGVTSYNDLAVTLPYPTNTPPLTAEALQNTHTRKQNIAPNHMATRPSSQTPFPPTHLGLSRARDDKAQEELVDNM